MRIKSYFAPSVQAAIALARKEFGDGVTLVTSHVASLDNRHLGEYEVVFAIEEAIKEEEPAAEEKRVLEPPAPAFTQLFQQAVQAPSPMHENLDGKLEQIRSSLIALGLEAALIRSFMTMLKAVLPTPPVAPAPLPETPIEASAPILIEEPVVTIQLPVIEEQPASVPKPKITVIKSEPQPVKPEPTPRPFLSLFEAARPEPRFSAAELAFMSSVSSSKEQKA
jgi:hypothetical protein